jgi:hypothetical protein
MSVRRLVCLPLYQRLALSVSASAQVPVIGDVAHSVCAAADELPFRFRQPPATLRRPMAEEFGRLARIAGDGSVLFKHDVVREYFLAIHISDFLLELGSPAAVAAALDVAGPGQ